MTPRALDKWHEKYDFSSCTPLLGEIRRRAVRKNLCGSSSLYKDLKSFPKEDDSKEKGEIRRKLIDGWRPLDRKLGDRTDYLLWRKYICRNDDDEYLLTRHILEVADKDWVQISERGLDSSSDPVVWGTAFMVTWILAGNVEKDGEERLVTRDEALALARSLENRLDRLNPLPSCPAGCAFVRLWAQTGIQRLRAKEGNWLGLSEIGDYVDEVEKLFEQINGSDWEPGESCPLDLLKSDDKVLIPFSLKTAAEKVNKIIYLTRSTINNVAKNGIENGEITDEIDELLEKRWKFALSDWRYARDLWKGYGGDEKRWKRNELLSLGSLGRSFVDAGEYIRGGAVNYVSLQLIPESLEGDDVIARMVNGACFQIRQCGLEVDPRFREDDETSGREEEQKADKRPTRETTDSKPKSIQEIRLHNDSDWTRVQEWYNKLDEPDETSPLKEMGKRKNVPSDVLQKGFSLARDYGLLHTSHYLLKKIDSPRAAEVEDFAHSVKRAQKHMPLGFSWEKQEDWRVALKNAWLRTEHSLPPKRVLYLHEMLLGRYSVHARAAKREHTPMYLERYFAGTVPEDNGRNENSKSERWAEKYADQLFETKPGTITPKKFEKLSGALSDSSPVGRLPNIAFVSVVLQDDKNVSVLAHAFSDSGPSWKKSQTSIPGLLEAGENLRDVINSESIISVVLNSSNELSPLGDPLKKLCDLIVSMARDVSTDVQWLILSVDPDLGLLPWQELLRQEHGTDYGVSLVPSFSWAVKSFKGTDFQWADEPEIITGDDDPKVMSLADDIKANKARLRERTGPIPPSPVPSDACSASVVAGHGTSIENDDIPSIRGPNRRPLNREEWYDLMNRRIVTIHSCWGGDAGSHTLGDWTGLSFLGLSLGSRLISAPATAIPPETARTLHERLLSSEGGHTFGERYLKAIEEDWRVALYNLYGFGFEPLTNTDSSQ